MKELSILIFSILIMFSSKGFSQERVGDKVLYKMTLLKSRLPPILLIAEVVDYDKFTDLYLLSEKSMYINDGKERNERKRWVKPSDLMSMVQAKKILKNCEELGGERSHYKVQEKDYEVCDSGEDGETLLVGTFPIYGWAYARIGKRYLMELKKFEWAKAGESAK